jgi:ParB-like chromosome segregation protein Spo0J
MQEPTAIHVEVWPIERVLPYPGNPRAIPETAIEAVAASLREFGWRQPIVVGPDGVVVAGHTRLKAAERLGLETVPVHVAQNLSAAQLRAYRLADNRVGEHSSWDAAALSFELGELRADGFDLAPLGFEVEPLNESAERVDGSPAEPIAKAGSLKERFGVAPFSVLNAREGWWQNRKAAWLALGIQSELGRGAAPGGSPRPLERAKANAEPGGSRRPAADDGKSHARCDGRGRAAV